jgi:hypothetical protein
MSKNGSKQPRTEAQELANRVQFNHRVSPEFRAKIDAEIVRIARKRDAVAQRVWEHFLSLKPEERDLICSPRRELKPA